MEFAQFEKGIVRLSTESHTLFLIRNFQCHERDLIFASGFLHVAMHGRPFRHVSSIVIEKIPSANVLMICQLFKIQMDLKVTATKVVFGEK